ncbi:MULTISPECIES: M48 family metallopeptidase [Muribaculum]|jgi:putative metalloprotease|uniref:Peptidase n=1 Tax=Muribaculum caecicola TaxID=3038144 RepID=A0AC61S538_9BACT|nr:MULTISPECIES: M48 family metallopeptidase [Muribaculum]THG49534.1 peptidase [Muribaculum caecicola]
MKSSVIKAFVAAATIAVAMPAMAQFNVGKAIGAGVKAAKAATLTDEQMAAYVKESVDWMDANNPVTPDDDPYTIRLKKLTDGLTEADGIPLNFKVYRVIDVNAFACPDGSVRVFSSLMDIMSDDELLGIIGHEIGHVAKRHSKKAFRTELLTGALKDGVSAAGGVAAKLSDSQLGQLSQGLVNSKFSQKQEKEADDYGYEFLKENGKNPWGMVQAFEKFQKMEDEAGAKPTYIDRMFSSHPETVARIKRMTERCQKDGIARQESK